jgi:cytochrome b pre-mRNA-processing protein 3
LNPLRPLVSPRNDKRNASKLYGAIVAQARLPIFYQSLAVPDTLQGRFLMLSLHLFALLHRLKGEGPAASHLAQELTDRFSEDMETVLREIGVGDLSIPKKMRGLVASSRELAQAYEDALASGETALATTIAEAFPFDEPLSEDATRRLAHYLVDVLRALDAQPLAALRAGYVKFPEAIPGKERGSIVDAKRR